MIEIEGKAITLGGRKFIAPPAPLYIMRKYRDVFDGKAPADMLMMADVVFAAVKRNYPDLTQEEFEEKYLDIANMRGAFDVVMKSSEVKEKAPGEV